MNRHHGLWLAAGHINPLLRRHLKLHFAALPNIKQRVIRRVVGVRVLRKAHALQRVRSDGQRVVQRQLLLLASIKCRAGQANHHNHHANVDHVAAVAPRIAPDQLILRPDDVPPALPHNHQRPAHKLRADRGKHSRRQPKCNQRVEVAPIKCSVMPRPHASQQAADHRNPQHNHRQHKVAPYALERRCAPRQQRTHAHQKQQEQPNRYGHAVVPRRVHCNLRALDVFAQNGVERSPHNHKARRQQHQVVE